MSLTMGEMLFYGGIAAAVVVVIAAVISAVVFSGSRKRLKSKLNDEYGKVAEND